MSNKEVTRAIKLICKVLYSQILKFDISPEEIDMLKNPDYYFNFDTEDDLK